MSGHANATSLAEQYLPSQIGCFSLQNDLMAKIMRKPRVSPASNSRKYPDYEQQAPRFDPRARVHRLSRAVADLMEGQNANWRLSNRMLEQIVERLDRIDGNIQRLEKAINTLASEQALLGNRVENAFSRALRTNIRLDEIEDQP